MPLSWPARKRAPSSLAKRGTAMLRACAIIITPASGLTILPTLAASIPAVLSAPRGGSPSPPPPRAPRPPPGRAQGLAQGPRILYYADARPEDVAAGRLQRRLRHAQPPQPLAGLPRQNRRPLDGDPLGQDERVTLAGAGGLHQRLALHFAQHRADDDRPVEAEGDLRVAADELHAQRRAGVDELAEDLRGELLRSALGQDHGGHEPGRARAHAGDVVRVDVDGVPADVVAGEGDGIRLGHQQPLAAGVNDGPLPPHPPP